MKKWSSEYFYGNKISEYGLENGYVDYRTLAKCGDMVLCNNIPRLYYRDLDGEYIEPEQVNGYIDNSEEIERLEEEKDELLSLLYEEENEEKENELNIKIDELQREQEEQEEIFQYYIIDDQLADILKEWTNEIVYYIPLLDVHV